MASASDDFNSYSDGIIQTVSSGAWAEDKAAVNISSHQAVSVNGGGLAGAHYTTVAFAGDHESQITKADATDYVGPAVRCSSTGGGRCYVYFNHGSVQKVVAGTNTAIASGSTFASGNTAAIRAVGSTITWYKNGSLDGTLTGETSIGSGDAPGMWFYLSGTGGLVDNWQGTDSFGGGRASKNIRAFPLGTELGMGLGMGGLS